MMPDDLEISITKKLHDIEVALTRELHAVGKELSGEIRRVETTLTKDFTGEIHRIDLSNVAVKADLRWIKVIGSATFAVVVAIAGRYFQFY